MLAAPNTKAVGCSQPVMRQRSLVVSTGSKITPVAAVVAHAASRPTTAACIGASSSSSSSQLQQQQSQQQHVFQQLQQLQPRHTAPRRQRGVAASAAAAATASAELDELIGPSKLEAQVFEIITYALKLAWTSETYYVHSWMVLLGLLKQEDSIACEVSVLVGSSGRSSGNNRSSMRIAASQATGNGSKSSVLGLQPERTDVPQLAYNKGKTKRVLMLSKVAFPH